MNIEDRTNESEIFLTDYQCFDIFFQKNVVFMVTKRVFFYSIGVEDRK